jgi:hypothetical protein
MIKNEVGSASYFTSEDIRVERIGPTMNCYEDAERNLFEILHSLSRTTPRAQPGQTAEYVGKVEKFYQLDL